MSGQQLSHQLRRGSINHAANLPARSSPADGRCPAAAAAAGIQVAKYSRASAPRAAERQWYIVNTEKRMRHSKLVTAIAAIPLSLHRVVALGQRVGDTVKVQNWV